jgi:hypothetical protein
MLLDLPEQPFRIISERIDGDTATDLAFLFLGQSLVAQSDGLGVSLAPPPGLPRPLVTISLNGSPAALAAIDVAGNTQPELAVLRYRDEGLTAGITFLAVADDGNLSNLGTLQLGSDDVLTYDQRLPYALATADIDNDGRRDLIAVASPILGDGLVTVLRNNGNLNFSLVGDFQITRRPALDVIATDLTGDGWADVAVLTSSDISDPTPVFTVEILTNSGGGILTTPYSLPLSSPPARLAAMDVDAANGTDLVIVNDENNEIVILFNNALGQFPREERYLTGGGADAVTGLDANGDGIFDLAVANDADYSGEHLGTLTLLSR